jgi:hypothetical protein
VSALQRELTPDVRARIMRENEEMANQALRCIAVAMREPQDIPEPLSSFDRQWRCELAACRRVHV